MVKASRLTQPLAGAQGNGVKSLYCELISRGHNSIIPSMVGSNALYKYRLNRVPSERTDTALQCLTISMLSRHQRTLSTHARFVNPCLGFKSRKKKLQLKRTHLHQQCWTRRLHACSPRRVRARRSRSAWRDQNPCSPARRSLPLDAPGTWIENSGETQSQSREFNRNIFQRAHDDVIFLLLLDNVQALVYAGPGPLYAAHFDFPLRS